MPEKVTYKVRVPGFALWATGSIMRSQGKTFEIVQEASLIGGLLAIDEAWERAGTIHIGWGRNDDASCQIDPNPALLGWPVGTVQNQIETKEG